MHLKFPFEYFASALTFATPVDKCWPHIHWVISLGVDESASLRWRHNGRDSVSNHQPHDCLLNRLCRRRSKKTSKLRVTALCSGNSPGTGEFPAQMASNAENVSIWWRHHVSRTTPVGCRPLDLFTPKLFNSVTCTCMLPITWFRWHYRHSRIIMIKNKNNFLFNVVLTTNNKH